MYKELLGYVAVGAALAGYGLYIRSIVAKRTKPHAFSWLLWGLLTGMIFVAQTLKGGGAGAWTTGVSSLICFSIGLLALRIKDNTDFSSFDWFFLGAALAAMGNWFFTHDPTYSVVLVTIVDVLGYASTLRKSYVKPHEEMATSFVLNSLKYVAAIFALQAYSLATWLYPALMIIMNAMVAILVFIRRRAVH